MVCGDAFAVCACASSAGPMRMKITHAIRDAKNGIRAIGSTAEERPGNDRGTLTHSVPIHKFSLGLISLNVQKFQVPLGIVPQGSLCRPGASLRTGPTTRRQPAPGIRRTEVGSIPTALPSDEWR